MSQNDHIARARRALEGAAQLLSGVGAGTPDNMTKADELAAIARDEIASAMHSAGVKVDIFADLGTQAGVGI